MFKILCIIIIFLSVFSIFTYKCYKKLPFEYDSKFIRRIYYLFVLIFIIIFIFFFDDSIKNITMIKTNQVDQTLLNTVIFISAMFLLFILWEHLFISCKSFKTFKFKDIEMTFDDRQNIQYVDKLQEKQIESLYAVLNAKIKMLKYIDYYIDNEVLDPQKSYFDILKEYRVKRGNVQLNCYTMNSDGINQLQREFKLTLAQLSSIMYSINLFGFCRPKEFRKQNYIFSRIKTKYLEDDIIVVLKGNLLIDKENFVIVDIINYFELLISNKILEAENQCTKDK